jgi:hypothetical protein
MAREPRNNDRNADAPRSRLRQVGLGLGAFGLGAAVWTVVTTLFGKPAGGTMPPESAPKGPQGSLAPVPLAAEATPARPTAPADSPEHVPTDLLPDADPAAPGARAIDAFRPDPTAPVPDSMRDSLRPATGPAPSLASDRGDFSSGLSQADAKAGA